MHLALNFTSLINTVILNFMLHNNSASQSTFNYYLDIRYILTF